MPRLGVGQDATTAGGLFDIVFDGNSDDGREAPGQAYAREDFMAFNTFSLLREQLVFCWIIRVVRLMHV